jgi:Putative Zn-dependent protease, contains TPR repeats
MIKPLSTVASIWISCCLAWAFPGLEPSRALAASDAAANACNGPLGSPDDAITRCSAVIDSGAASGRQLAIAYAQRGFARTLKRSLAEAEQDLDQAIKIDPDCAEAYVDRANFWNVSKKPDLALADAEQAVRLDPALPLAYFVRGSAAMNLGNYDRAIADYTESLRLRPGNVDVYGSRGFAYHRKGDDAHAIADYDEKLKIEPENVGTLLNRGDARRNVKDVKGGRRRL